MRHIFATLFLLAFFVAADIQSSNASVSTIVLLNAVTTPSGTSSITYKTPAVDNTFQLYGSTASSTGSATIVVQGANGLPTADGQWTTLATIGITFGTAINSDSATKAAAYEYVRAKVLTINGSGSTIFVKMGVNKGDN